MLITIFDQSCTRRFLQLSAGQGWLSEVSPSLGFLPVASLQQWSQDFFQCQLGSKRMSLKLQDLSRVRPRTDAVYLLQLLLVHASHKSNSDLRGGAVGFILEEKSRMHMQRGWEFLVAISGDGHINHFLHSQIQEFKNRRPVCHAVAVSHKFVKIYDEV